MEQYEEAAEVCKEEDQNELNVIDVLCESDAYLRETRLEMEKTELEQEKKDKIEELIAKVEEKQEERDFASLVGSYSELQSFVSENLIIEKI